MKKVSIIGLGWLGMPLANALQEMGLQVVGSKTTQDGVDAARMCGIDSYLLNLTPDIECDSDDLEQLLRTDILIITLPAGKTAGGGFGYIKAVQLLVDSALFYKVPRIIFTSSTSVYGAIDATINEDSAVLPMSESGRALVEIEDWLHRLPKTSVDILRLAGLVGPYRHAGRFLAGKKSLKGAKNAVNLVHQDDVINAIKLLIQRPKGGHLYNLCAPVHPTRDQFYSQASQQLNLLPPEFLQENDSQGKESKNKVVDGSRICKELGFEYHYPDPMWMPMS